MTLFLGNRSGATSSQQWPSGGGIVASGGVVYSAAADGQLYILDADTGKFIQKKFFGVALGTQPTLGQTGTGKVRLIQTNGLGFTGGGLGGIPGLHPEL